MLVHTTFQAGADISFRPSSPYSSDATEPPKLNYFTLLNACKLTSGLMEYMQVKQSELFHRCHLRMLGSCKLHIAYTSHQHCNTLLLSCRCMHPPPHVDTVCWPSVGSETFPDGRGWPPEYCRPTVINPQIYVRSLLKPTPSQIFRYATGLIQQRCTFH